MAASVTSVLVPIKVDAFVLNEKCCDSDDFSIAPISQPNYTFLRLGLQDYLLQPDLLDPVDLHAAKPSGLNARVTNLGTGKRRRTRLGVYLHWVLPPIYRQALGSSGAASSNDTNVKQQAGFPARSTEAPTLSGAGTDTTAPDFRPVPNRWLVTRRLKSPVAAGVPIFQSWVIQSDAKRRLSDPNDKSLDSLDLEVDVAPFVDTDVVTTNGQITDDIITGQAEVFVGKRTDFDQWNRDQADTEPHVDLNVMTSANPILVDYQPHNPNIFSMVDNFQYGDGQYLDVAQADYSIIGWHSDAGDDPMTTDSKVADSDVVSHGSRLDNCKMALKDFDPTLPDKQPWGAAAMAWYQASGAGARADSRILCHATVYDVSWDLNNLPTIVQAQDAGKIQNSLSFAVGTSPLDALVAFFEALATGDPNLQSAKDDILRLIHIMGETDDGDVNSLQKFSDEAYNLAFSKYDAGKTWFWKQQSNADQAPGFASDTQIADLDQLNLNQAAYDNESRELEDMRWNLFGLWWTHVSSFAAQNKNVYYKAKVNDVWTRLNTLGSDAKAGTILAALKAEIDALNAQDPLKFTTGSSPSFYQRKDPTILLAGVDSGWEVDFADTVQARLEWQVIPPDAALPTDWDGYAAQFQKYASKAPQQLQTGVLALLNEFFSLRSSNPTKAPPDPSKEVLPYFRETDRDLWKGTQPWRPLMIEWEALFYNIPFDDWVPQEYASENKYGAKVLQYVVNKDVSKDFDPAAAQNNDIVRIAGRNYLQPQSQSMFKTLLQQVLQNTNPDDLENEFGISKADQQNLIDLLTSGKFVSAPLTAITNSLLTLLEGAHLKPLVRLPHAEPVALPQAVDSFGQVCPDGVSATAVLQQIDDQGDLTPFASSIALNSKFYPLKPVQHGQVQFIKLNIIDKFGQAVHLVDPTPPIDNLFNTTCPVISDSLTIGSIPDGNSKTRANTALVQSNPDACPFFALPPSINQPARLNAVFVQKTAVGSSWKWQRISDWDSPVWGWIVVNYADSGLQFFLDTGEFYREVRFSSRGTSIGFKYLPFDPPSTSTSTENMKQLNFLIDKFNDPDYLHAFWYMINNSFAEESFSQAPSSYASFSSAIVGKPLALVNAGWSLELANAPRQNWSTSDVTSNPPPQPPKTLLNPDTTLRWTDRQWKANNRNGFTFHVKIGDASRRYDGLVGYFLPSDQPLQPNASDLQLDNIYTFTEFIQNSQQPPLKNEPRTAIGPSNYPLHTPYWTAPQNATEPLDRHDDKLQVLGMLVDPFLPVHAFSGILPTQTLTLPPWTVERALKAMTAFWRAGPLLTPVDVDLSASNLRPLDASYAATLAAYAQGDNPDGSKPAGGTGVTANELPTVHLPLSAPVGAANGGGGKFMYLQPYIVGTGSGGAETNTRFTPFVVNPQAASGGDAVDAKLYPGPYTAVEGFLQLAKPLDT